MICYACISVQLLYIEKEGAVMSMDCGQVKVDAIHLLYSDKEALEEELDRLERGGWKAGNIQRWHGCFKVDLTRPKDSAKKD